jgi:hypothetical protein
MEQAIAQFIGKALAYGGGGAVVAYAIFTFLGKKWIEGKFAERLEVYRNELKKELEKTRYEINALFNRVTKIHEKEFEVLPEAWYKMQDALGRASQFTSYVQHYPDLNHMSQPGLEEFLEKSRLHEFEKQELLQKSDKLSYYKETIFWYELRDVEEAFFKFHNYIIKNKIFLTPELQEQFTKIDDVMWSAIVERKVGHEANDREMWSKAYKMIKDEVNPIRDVIEKLVQRRLHYHEVK